MAGDRDDEERRPGVGVDASGGPVIDPTQNVLDLVKAAIRRQDDLRELTAKHAREIADLRAEYDRRQRQTETDRIDAIRAVDVGAVTRAAEVSAQQAATLAAQVVTSAEALRTQVAAVATATAVALTAALEPMQKRLDDLTRVQYEAVGGKAKGGDQRLTLGALVGVVAALISLAALVALLTR